MPDAPAADALVVVAVDDKGDVVATLVEDGFEVESVQRYDATRLLGHVRLDASPATVLDVGEDDLRSAWYLAQSLIAAESLGAVENALETSVSYAKDRHAFGRAIGSYQAIKHQLVEVLRLLENARSLLYYQDCAEATTDSLVVRSRLGTVRKQATHNRVKLREPPARATAESL